MIVYIYTSDGSSLLRTEDREPMCGVDFCDRCGDCLECFGYDACGDTGRDAHLWVMYEDELDD